MTKEQFLKFKQDLKLVIEENKIYKKDRKEWWNQGFKTEDEYKKAKELQMSKIDDIRKQMNILKDKDGNFVLTGNAISHWTYYCIKHQLEEVDRKQYLTEQLNKLKKEKQYRWDFLYVGNVIKKVEKIISIYEEI